MYTKIIDNTTDKKAPLIYIISVGVEGDPMYTQYIGKSSKGVSRPLKDYPKCVSNYKNNKFRKTYKKGGGAIVGTRPAWRKHVHVPLYEAMQSNKSITLTMFNVKLEEIDAIEQRMISEFVNVYGKERCMNTQHTK